MYEDKCEVTYANGKKCTKVPKEECKYVKVKHGMIKLALKTCYQEKKCDKVPFEKCEDGFLDKCKETPKKVGQKVKYSFLLLHCITKSFQVSKHRCVWPKRTIVDDTSC